MRHAFLRTCPDGERDITLMEPRALEGPARWFEVDLLILEPVVHYRFLLEAEDGVRWYAGAGPVACDPLDATDFRIVAGIAPPAWVRGSVFYQIFPDRFANGDPSNDPRPEEYEYRGKRPRTFPWEESPGESITGYYRRVATILRASWETACLSSCRMGNQRREGFRGIPTTSAG